MALQKITYENKTALSAQSTIANINKISDTDMNEIKTVVNAICDATDSNTTNIANANTKITNLENKTTVKAIIDVVYPVGSIYISKESVNPGTLWPGTTWTREAEGRCIIGVGTGYTTAGEIGGSSTVTLAITQIPSHTHAFTGAPMGAHNHTQNPHSHIQDVHSHRGATTNADVVWNGQSGYANTNNAWATGYQFANNASGGYTNAAQPVIHNTTATNNAISAGTPSGTNSSTGGGGSHNNMQPYIVMYIWRRTA